MILWRKLLLSGIISIPAEGENRMDVNILIVNGKCLSMDGEKIYDWAAVRDRRIAALGNGKVPEGICVERVLDAGGCTVMPGFIDSHFHMVQTSLNRLFVDLSQAESFDDIADLIRERGKENPEMSIQGIRIDETRLREKRLPSRHEIDRFWNDSAVWLNTVDYLTSALNTYGLLYYKIPFTKMGVEWDEKNMPTGIFRKNANDMLRDSILGDFNDFYRLDALQKLMPHLAAQGLTTVNAMEGGKVYSDRDAEFINDVIKNKRVYLDMELFFQTLDLDRIQKMGLKRVGGSLYVDGTFSSRSAAISFDYADAPGARGTLYFTQDTLDSFVEDCYQRRLQLALYTIGDRAIDMALKAHRRAMNLTGISGLRHRLEHVELPTKEHIAQAAEMGIVFSVEPAYESQWGGPCGMYADRLGDAYRKTNPFRQITDGGVRLCGGSDSDTTEINYIRAIYDATHHPVKEHSLTRMEATRMFTSGGAFAIGAETEKGVLREGSAADILLLDGDILACSDEELWSMQVKTTIKSGRIVYEEGRFLDAED